jgi:hypothetical protein
MRLINYTVNSTIGAVHVEKIAVYKTIIMMLSQLSLVYTSMACDKEHKTVVC